MSDLSSSSPPSPSLDPTGTTSGREQPKLWRPMVRLAVPSIIETLLQSSVFLVDSLMLARVGELELAAVSLTGIFLWRLTEVVGCVQKGTAAFVARRWGEGRFDRARRAATHGVILAAVLGLGAAAVAFPWLGWVFRKLGGENRIIPVAVGYTSMVLLAFPFTQMFINLAASLRASGDTRTPAIGTILINTINVVLNYILIFGKLGLPRLGMLGAGIATGISLFVGWAFLMIAAGRGVRPKSLFHQPVYTQPDETEKEIEAGGIPTLGYVPPPQVGRHPQDSGEVDGKNPTDPTDATDLGRVSGAVAGVADKADSIQETDKPSDTSPIAEAPSGLFRFSTTGLRLWIGEVTPVVLRVTRPAVVEELIVSVGFLIFYRMIAASGTTAMAAHSAVVRIESLSYMLGVGFAVSASTLVGQALGRGEVGVARRVFWLCALFAMSMMGVIGILFALVPAWFLGFFSTGRGFLDIGVPLLIIAALEQPMLGAAATLSGGLRGAGDTISPTISQFFGTLGVRVGIGYYLAFHLGMGIQGVYWGTVIDWTVRTCILGFLVLRGRWKTIRV